MSPDRSIAPPSADRATPTANSVGLRRADFQTLTQALDYAASGVTGANFHSGGKLVAALPYSALRTQALALAQRLAGLRLARGARVAIVAETSPDFLRFFFACQYAALVPVALPSTINLGGHAVYVEKLRAMLRACRASVAVASDDFVGFLEEAAQGLDLPHWGTPATFDALAPHNAALPDIGPGDTAYLQFTSGSTGDPKAVVISQRALLANARGSANVLAVRDDDRFVSWLPYYHDMGLVGCLLSVMAVQRSIDYLDTREFAMRPRRWLELISRMQATITYGPPFGYEICAHRVRASDIASYDFSHWRVAGIGAEMIDPDVPQRFAELLAPAGFDARAFVPSYGMAEAALAISFAPLGRGIRVDHASHSGPAGTSPVGSDHGFVRCGTPLPEHELEVRDAAGARLPERQIGRVHVRGPSIMSGYFERPEITARVLAADGWLDTGDLGYLVDGEVVITGRHKDMIIINGRNIWPQDMERIAERQPGLRLQDASAFSVPAGHGAERAVLVVQCHFTEAEARAALVQQIRREIYEELGIACEVELVPRHTLPRTSSGKLSRSATRSDYLERHRREPFAAAGAANGPIDAVATGR